MQIGKIQNAFSWIVIFSEISHVFCCVLPSLFTIMTFLVGLGLIGVMPLWLDQLHVFMHGYELPMIIFSALVLVLGWIVFIIGRKIDCRNTGCCHEPCAPKKNRSFFVLKIATFLFCINLSIYLLVHLGYDESQHVHDHGHEIAQTQSQDALLVSDDKAHDGHDAHHHHH